MAVPFPQCLPSFPRSYCLAVFMHKMLHVKGISVYLNGGSVNSLRMRQLRRPLSRRRSETWEHLFGSLDDVNDAAEVGCNIYVSARLELRCYTQRPMQRSGDYVVETNRSMGRGGTVVL